MSVYLALHTSKNPTAQDLAVIGGVAQILGAEPDASPAPLDWREGQVTIVVPLDTVVDAVEHDRAERGTFR